MPTGRLLGHLVTDFCVAVLSFNLSPRGLIELFVHFQGRYGIRVVPPVDWDLSLPTPAVRRILDKMGTKMSLKDAEIALQAEEHAEDVSAFVTWNARHFAGRLPFPAVSPRQWMRSVRH